MRNCFIRFFVFIQLVFITTSSIAGIKPNQHNWWPDQKAPKKIFVCTFNRAEANLAQSLSGVVAQALNESLTDEGIWLHTDVEGYETYLNALVKRTGATISGESNIWKLIKRYKNKSIIKGYVLYDKKKGDASVNQATVECGLLKAVMIDIQQEEEAIRSGLRKLSDVTKSDGYTIDSFRKISSKLNPDLLVLANPGTPNNRDYAIAHKAMVHYGVDSLLNVVLSWMNPLSPVIGWNEGPEFDHIAPCSYWGMINTASDWCYNLPLISCNKNKNTIKRASSINLSSINWKEKKNYHSFVMSDGDNMQWSFSNFIFSPEYWSSRFNSELAMSFTTCAVNLSMAAPDVWETIVEKQTKNTGLVEYGGGYYYPDLFGLKRSNPEFLLRELSKIINKRMNETGIRVFGFICKDLYSPHAKRAYHIFAEEIDPLAGMIAVQYAPYNGGHGDVLWEKNKKNESIPVMAAKYQVWGNLDQKGSGSPDKISRCINQDSKSGQSAYGWTIVHAWSNFRKGNKNEILACETKLPESHRGVTPLKWSAELLNPDVKLVNIEELLWRFRMEKHPEETLQIIRRF